MISTDKTGTADKIKEWVDNYNSLLDTFNSLTKYTPVKTGEAQNAKNGALLGITPCAVFSLRLKVRSAQHRITRI